MNAPTAGEVPVSVAVNGEPVSAGVPVNRTLADFLAERLGAGPRIGCDQGVCGACTVLVDGRPTAGCATFVFQVDGCAVLTIQGVAGDEGLHPVQQAFLDHYALQCGYCTPGMVLTTIALLERDPDPDPDAVRQWMAGNVCRCTGYQSIVDAVLDSARRLREEERL